MSQLIHERAELAVRRLSGRAGCRLDYSPESLAELDGVLAELGDLPEEFDARRLEPLVEAVGCYVLEVGRREHGGLFAWVASRAQPVLVVGDPYFHVALMTFDKVRARLHGEPADSLATFYASFSAQVRSATVGTSVLYL